MMLPETTLRVQRHTPMRINEEIERQIEESVIYHALHPDHIDRRLAELDREWDIERALETNAAAATLFSMMMGATVSRKWLILPAIIAGFLMQHALQGWCPPVSLFRRMGIRTHSEIDLERYCLKVLRGDFRDVASGATLGDGAQIAGIVLATKRNYE